MYTCMCARETRCRLWLARRQSHGTCKTHAAVAEVFSCRVASTNALATGSTLVSAGPRINLQQVSMSKVALVKQPLVKSSRYAEKVQESHGPSYRRSLLDDKQSKLCLEQMLNPLAHGLSHSVINMHHSHSGDCKAADFLQDPRTTGSCNMWTTYFLELHDAACKSSWPPHQFRERFSLPRVHNPLSPDSTKLVETCGNHFQFQTMHHPLAPKPEQPIYLNLQPTERPQHRTQMMKKHLMELRITP